MHIPQWIPRLPPGLLSAYALNFCTNRVVSRRKKLTKKAKNPDGIADKVQVFLFKPEERKYDCKIMITSGRRRAVIELMPARSSVHNSRTAYQLALAIYKHRHGSWIAFPFQRYRTWKYITALVRNVGERGLIHNFTEDQNQTMKFAWFAFKARYCVPPGVYPFPDLRWSNFITGDMYLPIPGDFLPIEPAHKLELHARMTWGKELFMEYPKGRPGVVRICPLGQYVPKDVPRKVNGIANTKFHFGTTFLTGDNTDPIAVDIREMANNFHLYGIGQIGSGKTNLWKQLLQDAHDMIENGIVSGGWFFDPSEKKAAGLRHLESDTIPFAVTPERTAELIRDIRKHIKFRNDRMEEINAYREQQGKSHISEWPVGQTIALPGQAPELYTVRLIMADEFLQFDETTIKGVWFPWAKTIRSLGFVMIVLGQDFRVNTGIPSAFLRCFDSRLCLRYRESDVRGDFLKIDKEQPLSRDPKKLKRGEFIIDLPVRSLDLMYGVTKHIPNEQQAV